MSITVQFHLRFSSFVYDQENVEASNDLGNMETKVD
jgi:hypothetical protein